MAPAPEYTAQGLRLWREDELAALPRRDGFRLRGGGDMSRLEVFADAAFAFALTMLVISVDEIPDSPEAFMDALKSIPAFLASFVQLTMFWLGHRAWSRAYGMDDVLSVWLTVALVAGVLVIVYPLRVMFASAVAYMTGGWAPGAFELDLDGLVMLFTVYGVSFSVLCGLLAVLHARAYRQAATLRLNEFECYEAKSEVIAWAFLSGFGLFAAAIAHVASGVSVALSGWSYALLGIIMPLLINWRNSGRPNPPQ